jgi:hypothetical protein
MKFIVATIVFFTSIYSYACVDISGSYFCPEEAANVFLLGTRKPQFKKHSDPDVYVMKAGKSALFEVGSWNPLMNPTTGDIDLSTETMAECKDNTVFLHSMDMEIGLLETIKVTPTTSGVYLRFLTEDEEDVSFECTRI